MSCAGLCFHGMVSIPEDPINRMVDGSLGSHSFSMRELHELCTSSKAEVSFQDHLRRASDGL